MPLRLPGLAGCASTRPSGRGSVFQGGWECRRQGRVLTRCFGYEPVVLMVTDDFSGVYTPSMRAGEAGFEVAQRAAWHRAYSCKYPTPRLPRTSISKIVLPKSSSSATVTSRNSRRHASSGGSPVLTANRTKSWSCSASQLNPFRFGSCGGFRVAS